MQVNMEMFQILLTNATKLNSTNEYKMYNINKAFLTFHLAKRLLASLEFTYFGHNYRASQSLLAQGELKRKKALLVL